MTKYLTVKQTADMIGISVSTLNRWRHEGKGLPYVKIEGSIRYDYNAVISFIEQHSCVNV